MVIKTSYQRMSIKKCILYVETEKPDRVQQHTHTCAETDLWHVEFESIKNGFLNK